MLSLLESESRLLCKSNSMCNRRSNPSLSSSSWVVYKVRCAPLIGRYLTTNNSLRQVSTGQTYSRCSCLSSGVIWRIGNFAIGQITIEPLFVVHFKQSSRTRLSPCSTRVHVCRSRDGFSLFLHMKRVNFFIMTSHDSVNFIERYR